jgi:HK97 family phage prohead protease
MPIERKSYPISDLKFDETGTIEAIVSVFNNVDSGNEIVRPGFFKKSIERKLPKGVWAHDWRQPIAKTLEAEELLPGNPALPDHLKQLGGTRIKGKFNLDTQRGREAYSDIKFGIVDEFSIGYSVIKDGKDEKTGARELIEGDWKEWSPVLVGMNSETHLVSIKSDINSLAGLTFEDHSQSVLATVSEYAERAKTINEIRTKEGRTLSSLNRNRLSTFLASLKAVTADVESLLLETEPKKADMCALRAESLRLEGEVLSLLAKH